MTEAEQLGRLGELHQRGTLSDDEFARAKARVLSGAAAASADARGLAGVNGLLRSRADRWIGGVCGGLARATGMASWIWRIVFTALALCGGSGVLIYALLWIFVPLANDELVPSPTAG